MSTAIVELTYQEFKMSKKEVYKKVPKEAFLSYWLTHREAVDWNDFVAAMSESATKAGYSPLESATVSRRCGALKKQIVAAGFTVPRLPEKPKTTPTSLKDNLIENRHQWSALGLMPAPKEGDDLTKSHPPAPGAIKPGEPGYMQQQRRNKLTHKKE
tara:strand:- start:995 stop:1465 length:471 start_codon:yes stop_codon:yes gene_type:complete